MERDRNLAKRLLKEGKTEYIISHICLKLSSSYSLVISTPTNHLLQPSEIIIEKETLPRAAVGKNWWSTRKCRKTDARFRICASRSEGNVLLILFLGWYDFNECWSILKIYHQVVEGLKVGNTALKKINDMMNIDDIEQILEETKEGIAKQQV